ncbi:MAG: hypothetical protein LBR06_05305 [Bacteroidales bacterium]|jgi:hypothetical protein|nr:hypothetical protein [Bacteroidales bacterium]
METIFKGRVKEMLRICREITVQALADRKLLVGKMPVWQIDILDTHLPRIDAVIRDFEAQSDVYHRNHPEVLNSLYRDTISIACAAQGIFIGDQEKQNLYSYNKALKKLRKQEKQSKIAADR